MRAQYKITGQTVYLLADFASKVAIVTYVQAAMKKVEDPSASREDLDDPFFRIVNCPRIQKSARSHSFSVTNHQRRVENSKTCRG